jgi:hypothetical protein
MLEKGDHAILTNLQDVAKAGGGEGSGGPATFGSLSRDIDSYRKPQNRSKGQEMRLTVEYHRAIHAGQGLQDGRGEGPHVRMPQEIV